MSLIIYPTTDYNSYISLADAEILITNNIINHTAWDALTSTQKELYLKQSTTLIRLKIQDPYEDSTPSDLELATVYLAVSSIAVDMTESDGKDNLKRIKIDGAIEKEYFTKSEKSNGFPDIVEALLSQYTYTNSSSFTLMRA